VQVTHVEAPAGRLPTAVLAHQPVQPALDATGQLEVRGVQCEHQRVVHHPREKPVGQDQLNAVRAAV
jgi:hypothetical protein